ncbi:hypothetical protein LZ554_006582 [Drepanopeziza brunnea f. sp. 'monogermtubi']|nr:hypothetical protein LZ554_006582 [Drepanopeziza brunnea f. sp. 'monogermtubi']
MSQNRPAAFSSLRMGEVVREKVQDGVTGETRDMQYTQCKIVGNGSFGVVFQTKLSPSGEDAAIKRVLQDKRFKNRELQIMRIVRHPNIVELKAFYYSNGERDEVYLNLVQEYVPETVYRASRYFNKMKTTMPILEVKLYIYQLFRALAYIHSQGICHRDIKPQNLLLDPGSGILKLCDFGSAKILVENEPNVSYICSRYYRAPELIFGATNYTTKIDVWSTGCVMAELMLGQPLFPGESGIDQLVEIIKVLGTPTRDQIRTMNPNYMEHKFPQIKPHPFNKVFRKAESNAIELISRLLEYTPTERLSAIDAMIHPFFDELRDPSTRFPDSRHPNGPVKDLPTLFDFSRHELSIAPQLNSRLVPQHVRASLATRGLDIDNFTPMAKEEMMARSFGNGALQGVNLFPGRLPTATTSACDLVLQKLCATGLEEYPRDEIWLMVTFLFGKDMQDLPWSGFLWARLDRLGHGILDGHGPFAFYSSCPTIWRASSFR